LGIGSVGGAFSFSKSSMKTPEKKYKPYIYEANAFSQKAVDTVRPRREKRDTALCQPGDHSIRCLSKSGDVFNFQAAANKPSTEITLKSSDDQLLYCGTCGLVDWERSKWKGKNKELPLTQAETARRTEKEKADKKRKEYNEDFQQTKLLDYVEEKLKTKFRGQWSQEWDEKHEELKANVERLKKKRQLIINRSQPGDLKSLNQLSPIRDGIKKNLVEELQKAKNALREHTSDCKKNHNWKTGDCPLFRINGYPHEGELKYCGRCGEVDRKYETNSPLKLVKKKDWVTTAAGCCCYACCNCSNIKRFKYEYGMMTAGLGTGIWYLIAGYWYLIVAALLLFVVGAVLVCKEWDSWCCSASFDMGPTP